MTPFPICGARARWKTAQKMVLLSANEPCHFCGSKKNNTTNYHANNVSIPSGVREGPSTIDGLFKNFKLGLIRSTTEKRKRAQQDAKKNCRKIT